MLRLRLFLAANAHRGPWHRFEAFFIDAFATPDTFSVLTTVNRLDGFLNESQARETTFVQVVKEMSVVANRGKITFVFRVFDLDFLRDFLRGNPATVYRPDWVLVSRRSFSDCGGNTEDPLCSSAQLSCCIARRLLLERGLAVVGSALPTGHETAAASPIGRGH